MWGVAVGGSAVPQTSPSPVQSVGSAPSPQPVLCLQPVPMGPEDDELLFVLHTNLHWELMQLGLASGQGRGSSRVAGEEPKVKVSLTVRVDGMLRPPADDDPALRFGRERVACCALPCGCGQQRQVVGGGVLLSVWEGWLTALMPGSPSTRGSARQQVEVPWQADFALSRPSCQAMPVTGGQVPPRVLQLVTWANGMSDGDGCADPMGNPAVAVLYADDALRLLHIQCVNLDLAAGSILAGPWGLNNVGITEAELECTVVPLYRNSMAVSAVMAGVLMIGQGRATYISGDGEASAHLPSLPACSGADGDVSRRWVGRQVLVGGDTAGECTVAAVASVGGTGSAFHFRMCSVTASGAAAVGSSTTLSITPASQQVLDSRMGRQLACCEALVAVGEYQVVGLAATGSFFIVNSSSGSAAHVADAGTMHSAVALPDQWSAHVQDGVVDGVVTDFVCLPLTRGVTGECEKHDCHANLEGAIALCTDGHEQGGKIRVGRIGAELLPAVASTDEADEGYGQMTDVSSICTFSIHAHPHPFVLCSHSGVRRGTSIFAIDQTAFSISKGVDTSQRTACFSPLSNGLQGIFIDETAPTLAIGSLCSLSAHNYELFVQVTDMEVHLRQVQSSQSGDRCSSPHVKPVWSWSPPAGPCDSPDMVIGCAVVNEKAGLVVMSADEVIFCHQVCKQPPLSTESSGFVKTKQFGECGGQPSALAVDCRGHRIAYAVWHSNSIAVLDADSMATSHVLRDGEYIGTLCRSLQFFDAADSNAEKQQWLIAGLADGRLNCYLLEHNAGSSTGTLVPSFTVRVGCAPVQLALFTDPASNFVYASSTEDLLIVPVAHEKSQIGKHSSKWTLQAVPVIASISTLCLCPVGGVTSSGGAVSRAVWTTRPRPGRGSPRLMMGSVDPRACLRWRTRALPHGETPQMMSFHTFSQTLVVLTEGPIATDCKLSAASKCTEAKPVDYRQSLRLLDCVTLEQRGEMHLDVGHVVSALLTSPSLDKEILGLQPANFLVASTRMESGPEPTGRIWHNYLSIMSIDSSRDHEDACTFYSLTVDGQCYMGAGLGCAVRALSAFVDRDGRGALAASQQRYHNGRLRAVVAILRFKSSPEQGVAGNFPPKSDGSTDIEFVTVKPLPKSCLAPSSLSAVLCPTDRGEHRGDTAMLVASGLNCHSVLRWHCDRSRAPHLIVVGVDPDSSASSGGDAVPRQLSCASAGTVLLTESNIGVPSPRFCNVLTCPASGGLRLLRHNCSYEKPPTEQAASTTHVDQAAVVQLAEDDDAVAAIPHDGIKLVDQPCMMESLSAASTLRHIAPVMYIRCAQLGLYRPQWRKDFTESDSPPAESLIMCHSDGTVTFVNSDWISQNFPTLLRPVDKSTVGST